MRRVLVGIAGLLVAGTMHAAEVRADMPRPGCVSQYWLYELRGSTRTICDGPRLPDGSWKRAREFYSAARYVPVTCSWSSYGGYCSGGYTLPELDILDIYPVTDATVLSDEPGWIKP